MKSPRSAANSPKSAATPKSAAKSPKSAAKKAAKKGNVSGAVAILEADADPGVDDVVVTDAVTNVVVVTEAVVVTNAVEITDAVIFTGVNDVAGAVEAVSVAGVISGTAADPVGDAVAGSAADAGELEDEEEKGEVVNMPATMEERMKRMEAEGKESKEEIRLLRDRLEEAEWAKRKLDEKVSSLEEEVEALKGKVGGGGGTGENGAQVVKARGEELKRIKEVEDRIEKRVRDLEKKGGGERGNESSEMQGGAEGRQTGSRIRQNGGEGRQQGREKLRCVVITDSNGKGAKPESIRTHIPIGEKDSYDIEIAVAHTLEIAFHRVERGNIDVRGARVVLDNLTNDVRGTSNGPAVSPKVLIRYVDKLRWKLKAAGAVAVVVCQLKPMRVKDVTPFNELLHKYLRADGEGGYGCRTQIRLDYLKYDGYHVLPNYDSVIDRTYACALMGVPVPCPTPVDEFVPHHMRRRWETEWPRIGGGAQSTNQGRRG